MGVFQALFVPIALISVVQVCTYGDTGDVYIDTVDLNNILVQKDPREIEALFDAYKTKYSKIYLKDSLEHHERLSYFLAHIDQLNKINQAGSAKANSARFGIGELADRSDTEIETMFPTFSEKSLGGSKHYECDTNTASDLTNVEPESLSWRDKNVLIASTHQLIGDCWAHALTALIAGRFAVRQKHFPVVDLSMFYLSNCSVCKRPRDSPGYATNKCAYELMTTRERIPPADYFPYAQCMNVTAVCPHSCIDWQKTQEESKVKLGRQVVGTDLFCGAETLLAKLKQGPVAVGVAAYGLPRGNQKYLGGVWTEEQCLAAAKIEQDANAKNGYVINHRVLAIGYDTSKSWARHPYITIQNSWGLKWADQGFLPIEIGACLIGRGRSLSVDVA